MAGATLKVEIDDAEVRAALNHLIAAGRDMTPVMRNIGEHLLNTTRERFSEEKAPDGTPRALLTDSTKRRKARNLGKILTERGFLRGNLTYQAGLDAVLVGSPPSTPAPTNSAWQKARSPCEDTYRFRGETSRPARSSGSRGLTGWPSSPSSTTTSHRGSDSDTTARSPAATC